MPQQDAQDGGSVSDERDARPGMSALAVIGGAAGGLAGAAVGVIDGLWSWSASSQFLGVGGKLQFLCFLGVCYGLAFALAGIVVAWLGALLLRTTRLGDVAAAVAHWHRERSERGGRDAALSLSLLVAGIPCVAGALGLAFVVSAPILAEHKHLPLIIASAMAITLAALAVGAVLTFVVARPVERALGALAGTPARARILSAPSTLLWVSVALLAVAGAVAVTRAWSTLSVMRLRWLWATLAVGVFALSTARAGRLIGARWRAARPAVRRFAPAGCALACILGILLTGGADGVRKASTAYSGLGAHIPRPIRALLDFDRDGYSSVLGGGDCDDWDAAVHPGAVDIPDDGIDQNCVGGDVSLQRSEAEVGFAPVPASVPADFNVLMITIDTVRADHFGAYGYARATTPNIDTLAAEGALFENGWAHAPSTRYSIPAILTGRYPLNVAYDTSIQGWPGLREKNTTIAEVLADAGLHGGAILNYWYFDRQRRMGQGFAHYDNSNKRLHRQLPKEGPAKTRGSSSKEQTDKALQFIAMRQNQRFFLWVHYYDPHFQYERHPEVESFGDSTIDLYDHEIRFTDHHIGRLLDDLRKRGLYDRTIVVITGDHGEGFGEHGVDLHGYHLYAAQTKVPFIVRVPGLAPVRVTTPVAHVDILPTLANLASAQPRSWMMGRSLVDLLSGGKDPTSDRVVYQQLSYEGNHEMRAAASQKCHVIYNVSPDSSWEMYRIDRDPNETRDIIDRPGGCQSVKDALAAWYDRSELPDGAAEALLPGEPDIAAPLDIVFGKNIALLSVQFSTRQVKAGHSFDITYTFEARGPLAGGWKVFLHFEGPKGQFFQGDHKPHRPFAWWRSGQYIRYTETVTVPRGRVGGNYRVWMGLFRKSDRQPVTGQSVTISERRALVGSIAVIR